MTDHKLDAVIDDFVGDGNGLFWIASVVVNLGLKHFPVNATLGVDLLDGHFGAGNLHVAILSDWACPGARDTDLDGIRRKRMAGNTGQNHRGKQFSNLLLSHLYWCSTLLL